jgi:small subunit ribosomal protein S5
MVFGADRRRSDDLGMTERVVKVSRVAKVVKGGRHLSFSAVVVVGDGEGKVGIGMGKADAVPDAVRKGAVNAKKNLISVPLKDSTIPHESTARFSGAEVMLKPAAPGTGVIAGGSVRAVVELAGVKDILTKARRSTNPINSVKAAFKALSMLRDPETEIAKRRQLAQTPPVRRQSRQSQRRR